MAHSLDIPREFKVWTVLWILLSNCVQYHVMIDICSIVYGLKYDFDIATNM